MLILFYCLKDGVRTVQLAFAHVVRCYVTASFWLAVCGVNATLLSPVVLSHVRLWTSLAGSARGSAWRVSGDMQHSHQHQIPNPNCTLPSMPTRTRTRTRTPTPTLTRTHPTHSHSGVKVDKVAPASGSEPAVVQLSGGSSISASKGVVVAVEGPEAARLLGQALQVGPVTLCYLGGGTAI